LKAMEVFGQEFDLNPHPRILPMLGEINLIQWRCLAELVDNAIDSFLSATRAGNVLDDPEINIYLPTTDDPASKLTVRDNGPGMDLVTLENAVKAGWTGNDPINNLGMFGMGFNIATARLGTVTKVWTTKDGDSEWHGLEIDFEALIRQRHFKTRVLTRAKSDLHEHGTEVSVERLKPEQRQWFSRYANRAKISKELARAYSTMIRANGAPISFTLKSNGQILRARSHCIWGGEGNESREVSTARYGVINAYQPFDVRLADRPFCTKCWQWLSSGEDNCPACGSPEGVVERTRQVRGWLGLQRYLHDNDYGIDFIRHGRKIEIANKDLFNWLNEEKSEEEYPTDDPRRRGRIVGEVHLDHCRVSYTKDRFDRSDPAWDDMLTIIRGLGPLRPDKASELGYGQNVSPLFLLFQAFRRSSPKNKVAGSYERLLVVPENDVATEMSQKFYAGEPEYQSDTKWIELVREADRQLLVPTQSTGNSENSSGLQDFGVTESSTTEPLSEPTVVAAPVRVAFHALSREFREELTNLRWDIRAFSVRDNDPEVSNPTRPWALKANPTGLHEFFISLEHDIFRSATMTPLDGLLAELSWSAMDFNRGRVEGVSFAGVLASLRDKYAGISKLDPVALSTEGAMTLASIAKSLTRNTTPEDSQTLFAELSSAEQEAVLQKMAARSAPQNVIGQGRFLEYAPRQTLLKFFETHAELFFDGRYWDTVYSGLDYGHALATQEARSQVVSYFSSLLMDAIWLAEQDPSELGDASRARTLRAALALELLAPTAESEEES
jgi:hypothetical protein